MSASLFERPTPDDWRMRAEKALKDRPLESLVHLDADGLAVRPLHAQANATGVLTAPRPADADGRAWDLRARVDADHPHEANAGILAQLEGGAASILLGGTVTRDTDSLARAMDGVQLELATVALDAGTGFAEAAEALAEAGGGAPRARLALHMDPLSALVEAGGGRLSFADALQQAAAVAARHAGTYPLATAFLASGQVVHEAGGTAAQELAYVLADAVALTEAGVDAGLAPEQVFARLVLGLSADQVYFDSLAKMRALRLMWRTLSRAWGAQTPAVIEVRSSRRMLSARDPWPNLLRLTAAGFAGAVGGADAVVLDGFSRASGQPDGFALRQARNTQLILMEEAQLGQVEDPASGSWFLDARTRDLAEAGWAEFQRLEREGGLVASLQGGALQQRVAAARDALLRTYSDGVAHMVGVTRFVDPEPRPVTVTPQPGPALPEPVFSCAPLSPVRLAAPFEAEQEAAR